MGVWNSWSNDELTWIGVRAAAPEEAMGASTVVANSYDRSSCSHALFASDNQAANVTGRRRTGAFESHAFAQSKDNKMMMKDHPAARLAPGQQAVQAGRHGEGVERL
jgi:hypothetical protein